MFILLYNNYWDFKYWKSKTVPYVLDILLYVQFYIDLVCRSYKSSDFMYKYILNLNKYIKSYNKFEF